jgi:hypothetical protein
VVETQGESGPPLPSPPPLPSVEVEVEQLVRPLAAEVLLDVTKDEAAPAATTPEAPMPTPAPVSVAPPITITISTHDLYKAKPQQQPQQQPQPQQQSEYLQQPSFPPADGSTKLDVSTSFALAAAQGIEAAAQGKEEGSRKRRERQVPAWYREFLDGKVVDKSVQDERRHIKRAKNR